MKILFAIFISLVIIGGGCTTYPRYRTGGPEKPLEIAKREAPLSTDEYLRLGMILQEYLGKPYSGKSLFVRGVDCSLFTSEVFKKFNKTKLPRTVREQFATGREIPYRNLQFGDLVFFNTKKNRVSHVGIFVGGRRFIHASTSRGVIISDMREPYWAERYVGARRILESK